MQYYMKHGSLVHSCVCFFFRSICEMNLDTELFTLQDSNTKLVAALHEANANVEQWKKQLAAYQEETDRLREQVTLQSKHSHFGLLSLSALTLNIELATISIFIEKHKLAHRSFLCLYLHVSHLNRLANIVCFNLVIDGD